MVRELPRPVPCVLCGEYDQHQSRLRWAGTFLWVCGDCYQLHTYGYIERYVGVGNPFTDHPQSERKYHGYGTPETLGRKRRE